MAAMVYLHVISGGERVGAATENPGRFGVKAQGNAFHLI